MKLIELHILQSFPVSCLNRDDVGSPKSAIFGGVPRARLSSQSLKHAIRKFAKDNLPNAKFAGERTKFLAGSIQKVLEDKYQLASERALELACAYAGTINKSDSKTLPIGKPQMETLFFASPKQTEAIADILHGEFGAEKTILNKKGVIDCSTNKFKKAIDKVGLLDAADIALFGRMVATDSSLNIEGAAMFSHALSTHRADNDLDFYSAVDELKPAEDDAGAGMIGTLEFTSAVYYRYAAVNLDLLADEKHLQKLDVEERRNVVNAFIRATLEAVPGARKNSMNANTRPGFVLGIYKSGGQPLQLINAFESPISANSGIMEASVNELKSHHEKLKETWNLKCDTEVILPDVNLEAFCKALTQYV